MGFLGDQLKGSIVVPLPHVLVTTIAGSGEQGYADSSNALQAKLNHPDGGAVAPDGTIYFADGWNHSIRYITSQGAVGTLAGRNLEGFQDGIGPDALFKFPLGMQMGRNGDLLVTDSRNDRVRRVITFGFHSVTTIAGSGLTG